MEENKDLVKIKRKNNVLLVIIIILLLVILFGVIILYKEVLSKDNSNKENNNGISEINVSDNANGSVIYLCSNNTVNLKFKGETINKEEVCKDATYVGKYICKTTDCNLDGSGRQVPYSYIDSAPGIALLHDGGQYDSFLYNFKTNKKISKNYSIGNVIYNGTVHEPQNVSYMIIRDNNQKYGIMKNDGTLTTELVYDFIGHDFIVDNTYNENLIIVEKDEKWGFLNYKTGKETTKIEYNSFNCPAGMDFQVDCFNGTYHLAYVKTDTKSLILDVLNNQVKLTLSKKYDYILPLGTDLLFIQDGQTFDIVDYKLNSVLKEKVTFKGELTGVNGDKDVAITIGYIEAQYEFDYETRTLTKKEI